MRFDVRHPRSELHLTCSSLCPTRRFSDADGVILCHAFVRSGVSGALSPRGGVDLMRPVCRRPAGCRSCYVNIRVIREENLGLFRGRHISAGGVIKTERAVLSRDSAMRCLGHPCCYIRQYSLTCGSRGNLTLFLAGEDSEAPTPQAFRVPVPNGWR